MAIDTTSLVGRVDLERLVSGDVAMRRVGRELHGPCPFCSCTSAARGHRCDRFRLDGDRRRWYCRQCAPNGGDAISYVQRRDDLTFLEARRVLGAEMKQSARATGKYEISHENEPDESPPPSTWQARATEYIAEAEAALWSPAGVTALTGLRNSRGLSDETVRAWRLGYQPVDQYEPSSHWGLDGKGKKVWLPRGVVIPWLQSGDPWAIKVRRPLPTSDPHKYHLMRGSRCHVLYGASTVVSHRPAILMEGELDVLLLAQHAGDITGCASAGANRADFTRRQLIALRKAAPIYVGFDNDKPGRQAMETVVSFGPRFRPVLWPDGVKDLGEAWQGGHGVRAWACAVLGLDSSEGAVTVTEDLVTDGSQQRGTI